MPQETIDDVSVRGAFILAIIYEKGQTTEDEWVGMSYEDIRKSTKICKSVATKILKELEQKGYLEKKVMGWDRIMHFKLDKKKVEGDFTF